MAAQRAVWSYSGGTAVLTAPHVLNTAPQVNQFLWLLCQDASARLVDSKILGAAEGVFNVDRVRGH